MEWIIQGRDDQKHHRGRGHRCVVGLRCVARWLCRFSGAGMLRSSSIFLISLDVDENTLQPCPAPRSACARCSSSDADRRGVPGSRILYGRRAYWQDRLQPFSFHERVMLEKDQGIRFDEAAVAYHDGVVVPLLTAAVYGTVLLAAVVFVVVARRRLQRR